MKATIRQAETNERNLVISKIGYGTYKISCEYRGKTISTTTHNSVAVDDYSCDSYEKDRDGNNRKKRGYERLINEIIRSQENK